MNIRFHTTKNLVFRGGYEDIVYLRKEDVVNYIDSVGKQVTTAK